MNVLIRAIRLLFGGESKSSNPIVRAERARADRQHARGHGARDAQERLRGDPGLAAFSDWVLAKASEQLGVDLSADELARQRLNEAAVEAADALLVQEQYRIQLPFLTADASGPKHLNLAVSRDDFDLSPGR